MATRRIGIYQIRSHNIQHPTAVRRSGSQLGAAKAAFSLDAYVEVALTVARAAHQVEPGSTKSVRKIENVTKALDDITRLREKAQLSGPEHEQLGAKLAELRSLVEALGGLSEGCGPCVP